MSEQNQEQSQEVLHASSTTVEPTPPRYQGAPPQQSAAAQGNAFRQKTSSTTSRGYAYSYTTTTNTGSGSGTPIYYGTGRHSGAPIDYARAMKRIASGLVGGVSACLSFFCGLIGVAMAASSSYYADTGLFMMGLGIGFGVLAKVSFDTAKRMRRFTAYLGVIGDSSKITIAELAKAVNRNVGFVRRDLEVMLRKGYFRAGYLGGQYFFMNGDAYREFLEERDKKTKTRRTRKTPQSADAETAAETEKKPPAPKKPQGVLEECRAFAKELHVQNNLIEDAEVTEQVNKLEAETKLVCDWMEKHPTQQNRVKRFADYYLPTTIQLLKAYNEVDDHAEDSHVAADVQKDIVGILYTINKAFQKLEDTLLQDMAMNVSAEISAMETMLAQDGLAEDDFTTEHQM